MPDKNVAQGRSLFVVLVALAADLALTVFKFVAAALTGSSSMLAEGFHSISETTNQALLLQGHASARREESPRHQFGYSRERYFWALVVSFLIFGVGSVAALFEAYNKLRSGEPLTDPRWAYGVLAAALLLDGGSFLVARRQARRERRESVAEYVRESKNPEVAVVLLQDAGAVIGTVIAFVAITLSMVTGEPAFDAAGSAAIGILLGAVAFTLVWRVKSLLVGEAAPEDEFEAIRRMILAHPSVRELISLRTLYHGPDDLLVDAQVRFDDDMRFREIARAIDEIEQAIRSEIAAARIVSIEPAVPQDGDPDVPAWQRELRAGRTGPGGSALVP
jgi:cation diffusion facilitator family transporter